VAICLKRWVGYKRRKKMTLFAQREHYISHLRYKLLPRDSNSRIQYSVKSIELWIILDGKLENQQLLYLKSQVLLGIINVIESESTVDIAQHLKKSKEILSQIPKPIVRKKEKPLPTFSSFTKIDRWPQDWKRNIKNVVLVLISEKNPDKVLMFREAKGENRGKWGFPAGLVDKPDKTLFDAIGREYKEESGNSLPRITYERYVFTAPAGWKSAIFFATTKEEIKITFGANPDGEIDLMELVSFDELEKIQQRTSQKQLRGGAGSSLPFILKQLRSSQPKEETPTIFP